MGRRSLKPVDEPVSADVVAGAVEAPVSADEVAGTVEAPVSAGEAPRPSWIGIWAFALAILGAIGLLPVVGSVLGIVLGRVGVRRAASRPVRGGRGLSLAAFLIGLVVLVLITLGCAAYALVVAYAAF